MHLRQFLSLSKYKGMITRIVFFVTWGFSVSLQSQQTVGLISYDKDKAFDGYNLIFPHNQPDVYLFNNCGEIVHVWRDSSVWRPGNTAYITEQGKLIKTKRSKNVVGNPIWFGGGGAIVEIRDWDNNLEWSFEINDSLQRLHHDIAPMPNGNILMIVWQKKNLQELIAAGRDTSLYDDKVLHSESVIEVNPSTGNIVWQWNLWDHMVQEYDSTKANFGIVADNPGKVNINYNHVRDGSWFHMNAIDYNAELDQIIVSVPTHNEIWIIDHSTTTAQAATDKGGLSGRGGELMYRWGNPAVYNKGNVIPQQAFYQHGVHWIQRFISPSNPNFGKICFFNNRAGADFSEVTLLTAPWDMYEWKYTRTQGAWGPAEADQTIRHPETQKLFSDILSNAQYLPNGNFLVLSGRTGYIFEVTPDQKVVWEYRVPLKNGNRVSQGSSLLVNDNTNFRINRYPTGYSGFINKDLSPKGYLELNPDLQNCIRLTQTRDEASSLTKIYPSPANQSITIIWHKNEKATIVASSGAVIKSIELIAGENSVFTGDLMNGLYYVLNEEGVVKVFSIAR